ncbi:hypothetical protein BFU36_01500 [Sulfolobus sp. A20]|uniref:DUF1955 domain-containing protein n=1 Tax=Sulfolobaceae TaxID=118883 RepID=UPI00084619A1|nr:MULTISPECIES: DUF1955 domain-containing protein [unclassified Sulfolobus]TRM73926.1 DUF1955 domain-containing protein [Sulfolobus sp. E5]TRM75288.1 DUF1955 domain-containing protein [Sulfolobus sp. A20-N-F8]TRM81517.1 DUF1955 domain-containing protein [Sulfolobus sp. D5]TRM84175.1 DUF1955 domain-containing protein [Sulfolobus sp. A20-N-F6]TRM88668.1 DUF1955 domain-containing protein [Sulfolobus sp. C3]TRM98704.1 DUF1955 domain-containing protein [Sulfolobus sp. F1]TRM99159.1 DUF1955 domai
MSDSQELRRKLIEAKKLILDGFVEQGIDLLSKTITSENIKESNWVICNIIDAAECKAVVSVLDSLGKIFNISVCANVKRIPYCYAILKKTSENVDLALEAIISSGKKDQLDKLYSEIINMNVSAEFLIKIANAYKKLGAIKESNEIIKKICESGVKEACENIKDIISKVM